MDLYEVVRQFRDGCPGTDRNAPVPHGWCRVKLSAVATVVVIVIVTRAFAAVVAIFLPHEGVRIFFYFLANLPDAAAR